MNLPTLDFFDHTQRLNEDDWAWFCGQSQKALERCALEKGAGDSDFPELTAIEISVISDEAIAQVHKDFLDDDTPTDVITFPHGEILVSLDTAEREARSQKHDTKAELLLYVIHGFLHLHGHDDLEDQPREKMHAVQERVLAEFLEG